MPDSPAPFDFGFGAAPGGNWPAVLGDPEEEETALQAGVVETVEPSPPPSSGSSPPGMVSQYAGVTAPTGWLLCNGAAVSRATFAALFAVITTTFGAGNGTTTFNLPNLATRFPLGPGAAGGVGATGGNFSHTHTYAFSTDVQGSHSHSYSDNTQGPGTTVDKTGGAGTAAGPAHTHFYSGSVFAGGSHNHSASSTTATNNPPYLVLNYIIKT